MFSIFHSVVLASIDVIPAYNNYSCTTCLNMVIFYFHYFFIITLWDFTVRKNCLLFSTYYSIICISVGHLLPYFTPSWPTVFYSSCRNQWPRCNLTAPHLPIVPVFWARITLPPSIEYSSELTLLFSLMVKPGSTRVDPNGDRSQCINTTSSIP